MRQRLERYHCTYELAVTGCRPLGRTAVMMNRFSGEIDRAYPGRLRFAC